MKKLILSIGLSVAALLASDFLVSSARAARGPIRPSISPGSSHQGISLRDRLIAGLQARRPTEVDFIDRVVVEVHRGKLPERLVNQTFFWSRDRVSRVGGSQRPIIYFQPVLKAQAKRLGVAL